MKRIVTLATGLLALVSTAGATNVLTPGDFVIAVNPLQSPSNSSTPGTEGVGNLFDSNTTDKYLNFGGTGTGFIATPAASVALQSFVITTGGDAPDRDPTQYQIYGTNSSITSANNSDGSAESWSLISTGALALPAGRNTAGSVVSFANATSYSSYKVIFPRNAGSNIVQLSEFQGYASNDGSGANALAGSGSLAIDAPAPSSSHPSAEGPASAINGIVSTSDKYLNFAKGESGIITTPSVGPTVVQSIEVVTAGDASGHPGRNPASYEVWGTNGAILSQDNDTGTAESWTLISSGAMSLPAADLASGGVIGFANGVAYTSYKVLFPTIANNGENSLAVAEIRLGDTIPETGASMIAGIFGMGLLLRRRSR
jgi:hypothetical protein